MQVNPVSIETDGIVCDLLLQKKGKPRNLVMCRASNLWDNRWRINVYTKYMKNDLEGQVISYSCFAKLSDDKELEIVHESGKINI